MILRASIQVDLPPSCTITEDIICALHSSPCPTTKSEKARVLVPAIEIAFRRARRPSTSSCRTFRKLSRRSPLRRVLAVVMCFLRSASSSIWKEGSLLAALSSTPNSKSVTFGTPPIALTTSNFRFASESIINCAPFMMRSALPTQVPPNLSTCHPPTVSCSDRGSDSGSATALARTCAALRDRGTTLATAIVFNEEPASVFPCDESFLGKEQATFDRGAGTTEKTAACEIAERVARHAERIAMSESAIFRTQDMLTCTINGT
mmetsp:Transcript_23836/g.39967  ORF Transcript_23836/g.39967 Transcript_23836/m.39967 type:complete len:263 (-) Transcript_23836:99-887(-)